MRRIALILTAACALAAPALAQKAVPVQAAPAARVLPAITVTAVEARVLRDVVVASGLIEPVERVLVQPEIEGQAIEELLAEVGDRVAAGEPLARLSTQALELRRSQLTASRAASEAALAQARAQLVEAEAAAQEAVRARQRTVELRERGNASAAAEDQAVAAATSAEARVTVARQGLAAAEAQVEVAEAQLADLELNLQRTTVTAPVSGEISERSALVGAIATSAGEPMFVIIRDGLLELRADVAELDVLRLAPDQAVTLRVIGLREPLEGEVRLVEPTVDATTRLGRVRIALDTPERVRSGLFAEADILVSEKETLAVVAGAVSLDADGTSVLVVGEDGRVRRTPAETGIRDGGLVEIVSGLEAGDRVVARAGAFVRDGDEINPVLADSDELGQ